MKDKYRLSPRTVGIISLIFAAWTMVGLVIVALGQIGRMFTDSNYLADWQSAPDAVILALFLTGGLGLIYEYSSGRFLVMAGAVVSFFTVVVGLILLPSEYLAESIGGFLFFSGLLDAALFYFAWKLEMPQHAKSRNDELQLGDLPDDQGKPPDLLHQPPVKSSRKVMFDVAYACFSWVGVTIVLGSLIDIMPFDYSQVLGMLVLLPIAIVGIPVALVGAALSLILWREWPLPLMTILGASGLFSFSEIFFGFVGLAYLGLTLRWWLVIRKKRIWM